MAGARLSFEERKAVLKWYFKFENISEVRVQRQWRNECLDADGGHFEHLH